MKPGTRERLKLAVTMLEIPHGEVAKKTGYTPSVVSKILKEGEPTLKFVNIFCMAFPKVNRQWILENEGSPLIGEDVTKFGFLHTADTVKVSFMEKQIESLTALVNDMKAQNTFLQSMLEKAMSIHPDLVGKLANPIAKHGKKEKTPVYNLFTQLGTNKGTFIN
ncbi:MAG: hypothetical protein ACEQSR_11535 [Candidatus Methylacidiphilales bacterium]